MTIQYDFDLPEIQAAATVPASTVSALVTIPIATGPFPLGAGELLQVTHEAMGFDASGNPFYERTDRLVQGGSPPFFPTMTANPPSVSLAPTGYNLSGCGLGINGSGDLIFQWSNNSATDAQDVTVRIRQRRIKSA